MTLISEIIITCLEGIMSGLPLLVPLMIGKHLEMKSRHKRGATSHF